MLFTTLNFAIFLFIVFLLYWFVANKSLKYQNILLLTASYFFYSCWDWRFLFLLIFSTFLDYYSGKKIAAAPSKKQKKAWLFLSIFVNLGVLGVFKYFNFFSVSFVEMLSQIGLHANVWTLQLILPVGISFYTFHGLSYVFDIYNEKIEPEPDPINYSLFVCFFPLLVAGPIERATHLLPQVKVARTFRYEQAVNGMRQILWGLFKKIIIADMCAEYVNMIFNNSGAYAGSTLLLGAVLFAFQIYGDFSGYSDIALGSARLFGFELLKNFSYPYFSRSIPEFWRRWHISLSSWFRDYLYIPLGGSKGGRWMSIRNTLIIFLVSGFWHGANWTFICWGLLNAIYILPSILLKTNRNNLDIVAAEKKLPSIKELLSIAGTFTLTVLAWILFRSATMGQALSCFGRIFSSSLLHFPEKMPTKYLLFFIALFFTIEWLGRKNDFAIQNMGIVFSKPVRWIIYFAIVMAVSYTAYYKSAGGNQEFIYFQF